MLDAEGYPTIDNLNQTKDEEGRPEVYPFVPGHTKARKKYDSSDADSTDEGYGHVGDSEDTDYTKQCCQVFFRGRIVTMDKLKFCAIVRQSLSKQCSTHTSKQRQRTVSESKKSVTIEIWEEYFYGTSMLADLKEYKMFGPKFTRRLLGWLPIQCIEIIMTLFFLKMVFVTCVSYSLFWKLCGYCMQMEHLRIHEEADRKNINLDFRGKGFQGPYFVYIRQVWCAHCAQKRCEKSAMKLLKIYRQEHIAQKAKKRL